MSLDWKQIETRFN